MERFTKVEMIERGRWTIMRVTILDSSHRQALDSSVPDEEAQDVNGRQSGASYRD